MALELAGRQHGVVSRRQLLNAGIPARTVSSRMSAGHFFPVFPGVYLVGRPQLTVPGAHQAALLATGESAVLGIRSAAAAWGFLRHTNPIETIRKGGGQNQSARIRVAEAGWRPRVMVHKTRQLATSEITTLKGLAITTPERTLRDLARALPERQYRLAFKEADRLQVLDDHKLATLTRRTRGHKGGALVSQLVQRRIPGIEETESLLEAIVLELVQQGHIPRPEINVPTLGYRPDFRWPDRGVIVEADGYEFHRGRESFEDDILRANRLRAAGWTVLRFTWRQVTERPEEVAKMIRDVLAGGPPASN